MSYPNVLKLTKPRAYEKSEAYRRKVTRGEYALAMIELAYRYECNLACGHCYASRLGGGPRRLRVEDVKRISAEADQAGVFQFNLQGGEPLMWEDLDEVIKAIRPEFFHITVTTNAKLLDRGTAARLKGLGVDKISCSLDSFNEEKNDLSRGEKGIYRKVLRGLSLVKEAGLQVCINTVAVKGGVKTPETLELAEFAQKNGFTVLFLPAVPIGEWEGRYDVLITDEEAGYIKELSEKYPAVRRDVFPAYGINYGCRTMNGLVYITENGDLLGCPFIHVSIGNVLDEPLADILKKGWKVKFFRDHNPKCLAAEDREFIGKIIAKTFGKKGPIGMEEAFDRDDLYRE
ncbi:MAG: radical SAM protein [Candidatus Omnitrophica bacterium]|nr:radical SAM protein [Candidatus Omnitrophota bacterium]